jgi:lysophospholipase
MLGIQTGQIPAAVARLLAASLSGVGLATGLAAREGPTPEPFDTNVLTHDPARYRRNLDQVATWPQLAVGSPTWGWLDFAFSATDRLARGPGTADIAIPLTVAAAGEERLVDNPSLERVAARVPAARFTVIPGAYHEILQETDALQALFWAEFDALAARAGVP